MKKMKKVSVLFLSISMIVGSVFVSDINSSYAATAYKKQLKIGKTYKYDLDGDRDKDSIKVYSKGHKLLLKVNNTTKTLDSHYYTDYGDYDVKIYDFNKKDKSSEIVFYWSGDSEWGTKILKFKNNKCMVNKHYKDTMLKSYDPNNGMVTFEEYEQGRYGSFGKAIGCFYIYDKVQIKGYNVYNQYSANTSGSTRKNKYVAAKKLTAYTSTSGKKKAFTINKGSKAYIYSLYQKGSSKYIRVKNSSGKYGYVKVGSSMLFTEKSCLWWR